MPDESVADGMHQYLEASSKIRVAGLEAVLAWFVGDATRIQAYALLIDFTF
jgi:hypothetical protein